MYKTDEIIENAIANKISGVILREQIAEHARILEDKLKYLEEDFHFSKSRLHKPIDVLEQEWSDLIDTVKAMLFAARGSECDDETLFQEMKEISEKPSEYISYIVNEQKSIINSLSETLDNYDKPAPDAPE